MKMMIGALALCAMMPLAACSKSGDEKLADRVENHADAQADMMENRADALQAQAKQVRKTGEQRGDAIDAANLNTAQMSGDHKDAIVNGAAPAVR
ncbi:hypothetical protein [Sphingomonas sp. CROZ-RG-20F-R02-07]|uniref:hypothetical protein n=1 Tax=Sphingomonas sp. CROZ-RG-20F-R02-07 TaxID=2914832 RepID=UPI001F592DE0|nr:hypothetical protein [Sphingomonas sp. CROZ-RG-20F-R02-07]